MPVTPPSSETLIGPDGVPVRRDAADPAVPPAPVDLPEYDLLQVLGRGGMGVVYLARHKLSGRREALKVVADRQSSDRFLEEVRAAARLSHPNVVTMYRAWEAGGRVVLAMEYVDGQDLHRVVTTRGRLPVHEACEYARQAALGLQHAFERGVVHRDVKPHNLILARDGGAGAVKVADFGLARAVTERPADPDRTPDLLAVGTPGYMAPEQASDPPRADTRSDVYGLGCTLYFLLTGTHPFGTGTPREIGLRQRHGQMPPLRTARPDAPAGLGTVLARMTAVDPAGRYPTPAAAAEGLAPFTDPDATRAARRGAHKIVIVSLAVAFLIVLVAVLGVAGSGFGTSAPRPPEARTAGDANPEAGFVPLFNGRDLSGWVVDGGDPDEWQVEGGEIVTTARRRGARTWLLTDRDFGDARFRFEYRLEPGANTGFAFRAVPGERPTLQSGHPPKSGPYHQQIEFSDDTDTAWAKLPTGQINGAGSVHGPALKPVRTDPLRAPGEWHAAEVEFQGQTVRVWVNGELVQDGNLDQLIAAGSRYPALARKAGRVGFQQLAGTVRFRAIAVREERRPPGPGAGVGPPAE